MPAHHCGNCGQSFSTLEPVTTAAEFCNLGCAIRGRLPVDAAGNFPVNQHLVGALVVGLLFFNQLLTASLSALLRHQGRTELALRIAWVSIIMAVLVWLTTIVLQRREGVRRGKDHVVSAVVLSIILASIWKTEPRIGLGAAATAALLIWNFRGLVFHQRVEDEKSG